MSTISIGGFVRHAPRVKSGMSYARERRSTDFSASFPDEAADYKAEIPELTARAKEAAAAQKAAAKAKK